MKRFRDWKLRYQLIAAFMLMAAVAAATGLLGIHYVNSATALGRRVGDRLSSQTDAIMELKFALADGHLIFEEILSGDVTETMEEVRGNLDMALWYADALLKGDANETRRYYAVGDPRVAEIIRALRERIAAFGQSVEERHAAVISGASQWAINGGDAAFDASYDAVIAAAVKGEELIQQTMIAALAEMADSRRRSLMWMSGVTGAAVLGGVLLGLFMAGSVTRPVTAVARLADSLARGDLTQTLSIDRGDEVGGMARSLNQATANLNRLITDLKSAADQIADAAGDVASVSAQMAATAEETKRQTDSVAGASERISENVTTMAAAADAASASSQSISAMTEQMSAMFKNTVAGVAQASAEVRRMADSGDDVSARITSVAAAVEEMTSSLNEVARHTEEANRISRAAGDETDRINAAMTTLLASSRQIDRVVTMIKDIADQTNMLALNATIEAAGAGDAGKGFAVVAGEVKALARQSAEATQDIGGQIEHIQKSTRDAARAVESAGGVMARLSGISEMIAAAVEEQTATAGEISKSIAAAAGTLKSVVADAGRASRRMEDIARSSEETSGAAVSAAGDIASLRREIAAVAGAAGQASRHVAGISETLREVNTASGQTAESAARSETASEILSRIAGDLTQNIDRFKT